MAVGSSGMARRRHFRMTACGVFLPLAVVALLSCGGVAGAGGPVQVSGSAFAAPRGGGWTEVLLVLQNGPRAWRGVVEVAGGAAKAHVQLSLPEHGQRVVAMPSWVEAPDRAPRLWIDGAPAGQVLMPSVWEGDSLVLIAEADARGAASARAGETPGLMRASLGRLPETWRSYGPFDLVILPVGGEAALRQSQSAALEHWVRWGGALTLLNVSRDEPVTTRAVGSGVAIAAGSEAEARATFDRWRRARASAEDFSRAALFAWERARPPARTRATGAGRPGGPLGMAAAGYAGLLAVAAIAAIRFPAARRRAPHVLIFLMCGASLTVWGIARAGESHLLEVQESAMVRAHADGGAAHVNAVVHIRALRSGGSRFVPTVQGPRLVEMEPPRAPGNPHRAIRWDPDGGFWERAWALGEMATLRVDGDGTDLALRVRPAGGPLAWEVENRGQHALRRPVVVVGNGRTEGFADIPPGMRARLAVGAAGEGPAPQPSEGSLAFWAALLPGREPWEARSPVLLAVLDPPLASLRFTDGESRTTGETHLVLSLPTPTARTRGR